MVRFYVILALALTAPQAVHAADYHHVHLTADPAEAGARWYVEHMDCEDFGRANAFPTRVEADERTDLRRRSAPLRSSQPHATRR